MFEGTLCGRCVNDTSVGVLRFNCRDCGSNKYWAIGFLGQLKYTYVQTWLLTLFYDDNDYGHTLLFCSCGRLFGVCCDLICIS